MARHTRSISTSSSSSSSRSSSSTRSDGSAVSTHPSTAPARTPSDSRRSRQKVLTVQEQCIHVARWIPWGLDMFCNLKQVIQVCLLLEEDEAAADGDRSEEEQVKISRTNILKNIDDHTLAHYKQMFNYVIEHMPYLGSLIGKKKKREELTHLISEMQNMINHICSEDASRLKSRMGTYAAPHPNKQVVQPVISKDSKSRSRMGFNHPELAKMLCPVKYLVDYTNDPAE
ncbi:uncharacterized protein EDB91DRAFT_1064411 [Suillus paluster]|uniref:uncharacterized protein n=1 Tax=Suillus paluster TaxID=48578 RepID=UPI001B85C91A|nr:uncharacterized protein EDB91DRAFT_1064411 [Suillus paluster]KAG1721383.1 hypothetical protein EDB91DRAFT_1064411 [Suillus paluster]